MEREPLPSIHVCLYVDALGTVLHNTADIYQLLEQSITRLLRERQPTFLRDQEPQSLLDTSKICDLYVFDISSMVVEGGNVETLLSALYSAVITRPGTLFLLSRAATVRAFWSLAGKMMASDAWKRLNASQNIVQDPTSDCVSKMLRWFQISETVTAPPVSPTVEPSAPLRLHKPAAPTAEPPQDTTPE